jgi:RNA polymerase sigma-70 factor (ECF subfamily)
MGEKSQQHADDVVIHDMLRMGDTRAVALMFETWYPMLLNYAGKFVPHASAEDIVQDIFVELQKRSGSLEIKQSVKAYLIRAVHNKCMDHIRHLVVRKKYEDQALSELSLQELNYFDPQKNNTSLLLSDNTEDLQQAIARLPARCREILLLKYQHDLNTREIAQLLNVSTRTVETQLYKAVKTIRGLVKKLSYLFSLLACMF